MYDKLNVAKLSDWVQCTLMWLQNNNKRLPNWIVYWGYCERVKSENCYLILNGLERGLRAKKNIIEVRHEAVVCESIAIACVKCWDHDHVTFWGHWMMPEKLMTAFDNRSTCPLNYVY